MPDITVMWLDKPERTDDVKKRVAKLLKEAIASVEEVGITEDDVKVTISKFDTRFEAGEPIE